ncbi:MAG: nicotinate-nucleotide--dimethylbenzimidazole phosphoribosyltransferase [Armatimonadetes bacterium CG07_land_8_20_14_0_80_40_9]|nr:MAG: nicotinate-nucleotide--dimethylbenzimidazole phosphoribosyltransferase [Armatimonadetes bacterium CG07_land_8_20_14_0_80_40_9]
MDKLNGVIKKIRPIDREIMKIAQERLDSLTKPKGSLGQLEELAKKISGITGSLSPKLDNKVIVTLAGDHGVVEEGVSAYPQEVTPQMVYNFLSGGAGINVLARHTGCKVIIVDMGVAKKIKNQKSKIKNFIDKKIKYGTNNMAKERAMSREDAVRSIEAGMEVIEEIDNLDILGLGDMGIGNTTSSSAIIACLSGLPVKEVTGRGTGIDDKTFFRKVKVIEEALSINQPNPKDPIDVLSKVGGFEIGGIAGCVLKSASLNIPVVIDGFISTAGALIAYELAPEVREYLIASHNSQERGHRVMLERMGLKPLLDLNLCLGEGTGACLGINLAEASIKILTQMATFESAGVSKERG